MQPLGQRLEPMDALGPVEEGRGPGDDKVETGESAGVDLVDELPERVETLIPDVAPDPLDGLDLVEHDQHPHVTGVSEDRQDALEEVERTEVVDVALHPGIPLGLRGHVRLSREPGEDPLSNRVLAVDLGPAISPQCRAERGGRPGDVDEPLLEEFLAALEEALRVVRVHLPLGEDVLFEGEEPPVDDVPKGALRGVRRRQSAR